MRLLSESDDIVYAVAKEWMIMDARAMRPPKRSKRMRARSDVHQQKNRDSVRNSPYGLHGMIPIGFGRAAAATPPLKI